MERKEKHGKTTEKIYVDKNERMKTKCRASIKRGIIFFVNEGCNNKQEIINMRYHIFFFFTDSEVPCVRDAAYISTIVFSPVYTCILHLVVFCHGLCNFVSF